jgi:two-component system phosphate regulon response regulator PhoB
MGERVLLVEDDDDIRELVRYNLVRAGYAVEAVTDGDAALEHVLASPPDAVILDLMLPGRNGLEVLREVRDEPSTSDLPVIVITARAAEMDRILGLDRGADDYVSKPFSPRELIARLAALLRRSRSGRAEAAIEVGALRIDVLAREARCDERRLKLTRRQFDLLAFLARRPGRVFSRDELLRRVWGFDFEGQMRAVDVIVRRLRLQLGAHRDLLETIPGSGYRMRPIMPPHTAPTAQSSLPS